MRTENEYGILVFKNGNIIKRTTHYFTSLKEMLDYRETMGEQKHLVHLESLRIKIEEFIPFERSMVEGDEEE